MTNNYYRVRIQQVPRHLEEEISQHCFASGASGVSEALHYHQPDLTYDPKIISLHNHELDVYFSERPGDVFFQRLQKISPQIQWNLIEEESKDWLQEWKKGFHPFKLVGPYWVVPSWLISPSEAEKSIIIDPGMAFGTGTHATTQMMAYFIYKLSKEHSKEIPQWSLLDVGTGTAILAILSQMCGLGLITGIEIDPEARRVAKENIQLNHVMDIEISDTQIEDLRTSYDVVVANIIDGVLLKIRPSLLKVLKPEGHLLLTGILQERDDLFFNQFIENTHLKVIRRIEKDEWVGYWLQNHAPILD